MAQPALTTYAVAAGQPIHGGRWPGGRLSGGVVLDAAVAAGSGASNPSALAGAVDLGPVLGGGDMSVPLTWPAFDSIVDLGTDANAPLTSLNQKVRFDLHASGGGISSQGLGTKHKALLAAGLTYLEDTEFYFCEVSLNDGLFTARPSDAVWKGGARTLETYWHGRLEGAGTPLFRPVTWARLDSYINWLKATYTTRLHPTNWCATGQSMGGWGIAQWAIRRPHLFAAVYANMPSWRWKNSSAQTGARFIYVPRYEVGGSVATLFYPIQSPGSEPQLDATVGYGSGSITTHLDAIAYVSNAANPLPWIGWTIGLADPYTNRDDLVAVVAALRARGAGFACRWHAGGHTGDQYVDLVDDYPYGTFDRAAGWPVFSEYSLDDDPALVDAGAINAGLKWRNLVQSAGAWSCEVTSSIGPCSVKVKPYSPVYAGTPAPQLVTIPAANTWVAVSF